MRRFASVCLAITFLITGMVVSVSQGQDKTGPVPNALFNPDVATVWHKLGIPQSVGRFKKYRESRVNRKGTKPGKETKPKLVKLTDPANLAPDAPKMLQAAAEIKMAEDLAPQKIKALKYLATLGCGCYDKDGAVEAAVLEAMDDCTVEVRKEALNLVLAQVSGGQCGCQSTCNAKSCCSKLIYEKLEEKANKVDDTGCPTEPDASVRYLAQQVLSACPYPRADDVNEGVIEDKGDQSTESNDSSTESGEGKSVIEGANEANQGARSTRRSEFQQVSMTRKPLPVTPSLQAYSPEARSLMQRLEVTGVVQVVELGEGNATIAFDEPYEFPQGLEVVIATNPEQPSFGVVEVSETGSAVIKVKDQEVIKQLKQSQRIRLGVLK